VPSSALIRLRRLNGTVAVRTAIGVTVTANLVFVVSILMDVRDANGYSTLWDGWVYHIATTLPGLLAGLRAWVDRRCRSAWLLVAAGVLLNTFGNLVYTYRDQNIDPVPFPALSDVGYLGSYVAFAVALVILTQRQLGGRSKAARLDGFVIGLSAGAVAVSLWFESILRQVGSTQAVVVGLAYPLFDVVFLVIVVSGFAAAQFRFDWSSAAFGAGALTFAIGDIVYLNQVAADTYVPGTPLEWTWLTGILLFGLAAWAPTHLRGQTTKEHWFAGTVVPALAAIVALSIVGFGIADRIPDLASLLAMSAIAVVFIRVSLTVRELRRANSAFYDARTDDLTSLLNRRGFGHEVDRLLVAAPGGGSVMLLDLNGFKEVNDSLGHPAGDHLLVILGERFSRALPKGALVGRLGGDEFGFAVPGDHELGAISSAAVLQALHNPVTIDGMAVRVGASIGIATWPLDGTTKEDLLRAADVAMYYAKKNHLGSSWYSADRDPNSRERLALIQDLRIAIEQRSFEMHYQPTIAVDTGRVVGMEALIRWNHPEHGLMAPDRFIPLAERVGLIPAITRAVLDLSIAHLAEMRRAGHDLRLSVNISAMDLVDEELPTYIRTVLNAHQVDAGSLTLEITETALASDAARAERTLNALRAEGIRISIDDFGVGYSSLSQLLNLPLDELKIDRSFIANVNDDVRAQAILSATVELGRTLGLEIVAEGIETTEALDEVSARGVDVGQGFLFSRALPAAEFNQYTSKTSTSAAPRRPIS